MATAVSLSTPKGEQDTVGDPTNTLTVGTSAPGAGDIELRVGSGITNLFQVLNALDLFKAWFIRYPGGQSVDGTGAGTTLPGV